MILKADARWSQRLRIPDDRRLLRSLAAILAHSGDSWFWLLALFLVWLRGDAGWKAWAISWAISVFVLALIVMVLKFSFRRRRPEGEWGNIYRQTDPHSFPSGHAARAALLATLATGMGPAWLSPVLIVWAPLMALARVGLRVHYLSDIAVGALLGVTAGLIAIRVLA